MTIELKTWNIFCIVLLNYCPSNQSKWKHIRIFALNILSKQVVAFTVNILIENESILWDKISMKEIIWCRNKMFLFASFYKILFILELITTFFQMPYPPVLKRKEVQSSKLWKYPWSQWFLKLEKLQQQPC